MQWGTIAIAGNVRTETGNGNENAKFDKVSLETETKQNSITTMIYNYCFK